MCEDRVEGYCRQFSLDLAAREIAELKYELSENQFNLATSDTQAQK